MASKIVLASTLICIAIHASTVDGSIYDPGRYIKALGLQDKINVDERAAAQELIQKYRTTDALKQHPEWQRLLKWQRAYQAGDHKAGAAFAGKIPHDLIHHIASDASMTASHSRHHHHHRGDDGHHGHHQHQEERDVGHREEYAHDADTL